MKKWETIFPVSLISAILLIFIASNLEEGEPITCLLAILGLACIFLTVLSIIKINVNNAKIKNMTGEQYVKDAFSSLSSSKNPKVFVKCPYCNSTDTVKISNLSKATNIALFGVFALHKTAKQWRCNNCKSDF